MIAKRLETVIAAMARKTDVSGRSLADLVQRFQKLRSYGLLPRSRGKNAQNLPLSGIAAGILSITTTKPGYAGVAVKSLLNLRPVGGVAASFGECKKFGEALEKLLSDEDTLDSVVEVRVSDSEIYINGHGRASITYMCSEERKTAYYVGDTAVSLLQPGMEKTHDPTALFSSVITETVFYPPFFRRISNEIKRDLPIPEGISDLHEEEEDEEARKVERAKRLGITPSSRFLNIGVDNQVTWPKEETLVDLNGYKLVLMPKTKEHTTSVHIDLHANKLTNEEAMTIINRFLSIMTWCDDQFAVQQEGWSGNPVPVPVPRRNLAFTTAHAWPFGRKIPESSIGRKALALYRQGRNAEQNELVSYAVLSYYKVIELKHRGKEETKKWLRNNFDELKEIKYLSDRLALFEKDRGSEKPHDYLHNACRVAVAHASEKTPPSDPDDLHEIKRLHVAANILREMARLFIKNELEISDNFMDGS